MADIFYTKYCTVLVNFHVTFQLDTFTFSQTNHF